MLQSDVSLCATLPETNGQCPGCGGSLRGVDPTDVFLSIQPQPRGPGHQWEPNTKLDRFLIQEYLSSGSLGDVYLAHDMVAGRDVTIKVVEVGPEGSRLAAGQLRRERAVYGEIQDCRHILQVYDIFEAHCGGAEMLVMSMERADGGTFRDWLRNHRHDGPIRQTWGPAYFRQICAGVDALHAARIAHLDLKPENVLLVGQTWKVADLGLASVAGSAPPCEHCLSHSTFTETSFGTPVYMSPEHFFAVHPSQLDARADIYSLGVMHFEILHPQCRPPFQGSYRRLRELHTLEPAPPLPDAGERESCTIARCLEKNPARRYQTVRDLLSDLNGNSKEHEPIARADAQENLDAMWRRACLSIEERRFSEAQRLCGRILARSTQHAQAEAMLRELQGRCEQAGRLYARIEEGLSTRSLDELIALIVEAAALYPEHPSGRSVQVTMGIQVRQYRQAMEEGVDVFRSGDLSAALSRFERAKALNPGAAAAERPAHLVAGALERIQGMRAQIDQAIAAGDRNRAMTLARGIDEYTNGITGARPLRREGPQS
ncbi:MAG: protein kinase [Acidobacteriota bacterium]